jgi:hypothetical protein
MQQNCNKDDCQSADDPGLTRADAVEWLEAQIIRARHRSADHVGLSLPEAQLILAAAKAGQHKGQGRRRAPDTRGDRVRKQAIVAWAKRRHGELLATETMAPWDAEQKAAEEAAELAHQRYGLAAFSASTIRRRMQVVTSSDA